MMNSDFCYLRPVPMRWLLRVAAFAFSKPTAQVSCAAILKSPAYAAAIPAVWCICPILGLNLLGPRRDYCVRA